MKLAGGRTVISRGEQMGVVFHAADEDGRAIELFGDAAEMRVQRVACGFIAQERAAVFGGEDQMNVNGGNFLLYRRLSLLQEFVGRQNRNFARDVISVVPRYDSADAAFSFGGAMLDRILEILEAR